VGKATDADGNRIDVKGPIPDLARIAFDERRVLIIFDADLAENESVQAARAQLSKELRSRAAHVSWFRWPENRPASAKGIDDLLAALGPEPVMTLIEEALQRQAGPPDLLPYFHSDTGNADRLVALYGADLRYCFAFRKWLRWDGQRWIVDETAQALKLGKRTITTFLSQAIGDENREKFARASLDARRLQSMLTLAQPELPILPAELDRADYLLNFRNGTVDLRTGKFSPHRRSDFISKLVHHNFNPRTQCPRWFQFLNEIMGGGPDAGEGELQQADELISYLQLALGYSLTGDTSERAIFVCYGSGANGKTTLLSVVRDLIREYAATIGLDVLTTKEDSSNVAAARAKLLGVRFVSTSETEEGQRLSAARLKRICQGPGGEIEACRKYENPITFRETGKLWLDANHKPELPATDAAVWSRVHLIPFTVTIPKDRQDRQLREKLLAEAEGILAWLVLGATRFYAEGLPNSKIISSATEEWRASLDRVKDFLEERTVKGDDPAAYIAAKELYASYRRWCEESSEKPLSEPRFRNQIAAMDFERQKQRGGVVWLGLRFRQAETTKCDGVTV
jgi:putative DNA primase/helicase